MRIIKVEQGSDEWKAFREGKISGTKIGKLWSKSRKTGELYDTSKTNLQFYQVMAERLAVATADGISDMSAMERGKLLENEAVQTATERLGLNNWTTDNVWQDETDDSFLGYLNDGQVATSEEMEEFENYQAEKHEQAILSASKALQDSKTMKDLAKAWNTLPATLKAELKTIKDECKNRLEGKSNENN